MCVLCACQVAACAEAALATPGVTARCGGEADARDGKHGNCVGAAALGVLGVHCPQGLNEERWRAGLAAFERGVRGKVIDAPGGPSSKPTVTLPAVSLAMVLLRRPFILFALLRRHRAPRPRRATYRRDAPRSRSRRCC